jgi:EAL domain-containing protein (putative c-di-GMP-specific phosphodiesterase class I)
MGINLSAAELRDQHLTASIERTIAASGVAPEHVAFEITEQLVLEDSAFAGRLLARLRGLGVHLALDDFGTTAAPLLHLKELPVQAIKIDRAFIAGLGRDAFDGAMVDMVVELCRRLDLVSCAEGVETPAQEDRLRSVGCLLAQGHLFGPPVPASEIERRLTGSVGPIDLARLQVGRTRPPTEAVGS